MADSLIAPETNVQGKSLSATGARKTSGKNKRSRAREFAVQGLYQSVIGKNLPGDIDTFTRDLSGFQRQMRCILMRCCMVASHRLKLLTN